MTTTPKLSKRDLVIESLRLIGRPLGPHLIGVVARATFGQPVPDNQSGLVALVESEKKRYARSPEDGPFIVPMLSTFDELGATLTPYVSMFGLSDFPIEYRLARPLSGRWQVLETALRVLDVWESGKVPQWNDRPWANPVKKVWGVFPDEKYDLSEAGCAAMRRRIQEEQGVLAEEYRQSLTPEILADVESLSERERLFGRAWVKFESKDLGMGI